MDFIDKNWLKPLFLGSIFMGSGGGGKTDNLLITCQELFASDISIPLLSIKDLEFNSIYATTGLVGSPEVLDDFHCTGHEGISLINKLSNTINTDVKGIFTLECAGINVLYPLLVSALSHIPIIDGDCIGRAFPELQMTTFHLNNYTLKPLIFSNTQKETFEFSNEDNFMLELNIRHMLSKVNNIGFFAGCPVIGKELQKILIPNTISLTYEIGKSFIDYSTYEDILFNLIKTTKNSIYGASIELFAGTIDTIENIEHKHWQSIYIKGIKDYSHDKFQILTQNENLIAYKNGALAAMVPDLISMIDLDTLKPVGNNSITQGMNVAVIGTPAPLVWKTDSALNIVGPQCFGYKSPYKSLEELYYNYYY